MPQSFRIPQAGTTKLVNASTVSGAQATQVSTGNEQGVLLSNPSSQPIYVATAQTSAVSATQPTTTAAALGMCLPAGYAHPFLIPPGGWLDAVSSAGTMPLYVTPGYGL